MLFNNMCYYVDTSFVFDILNGEHLCSDKYLNSTLVKFDSHEWGNVDAQRFVGRTLNDILLEFFNYQLEKRLMIELKTSTSFKHWLRLLLGDRTDNNSCVLRYYVRMSGVFTILHRCHYGGHPVCQCEPIQHDVSTSTQHINETNDDPLKRDIDLESSTTDTNRSNSTNISNTFDEQSLSNCDNCTNLIADEDLVNNETYIYYKSNVDVMEKNINSHFNYRSLIMFVTIPLLALVVFVIGSIFLIRYVGRNCGWYSTGNSTNNLFHRRKRPSIITTSSDVSTNRTVVLYNRLPSSPSPSATIDVDMVHPFDDKTIKNDDTVHLLSQIKLNENNSRETEEESS